MASCKTKGDVKFHLNGKGTFIFGMEKDLKIKISIGWRNYRIWGSDHISMSRPICKHCATWQDSGLVAIILALWTWVRHKRKSITCLSNFRSISALHCKFRFKIYINRKSKNWSEFWIKICSTCSAANVSAWFERSLRLNLSSLISYFRVNLPRA